MTTPIPTFDQAQACDNRSLEGILSNAFSCACMWMAPQSVAVFGIGEHLSHACACVEKWTRLCEVGFERVAVDGDLRVYKLLSGHTGAFQHLILSRNNASGGYLYENRWNINEISGADKLMHEYGPLPSVGESVSDKESDSANGTWDAFPSFPYHRGPYLSDQQMDDLGIKPPEDPKTDPDDFLKKLIRKCLAGDNVCVCNTTAQTSSDVRRVLTEMHKDDPAQFEFGSMVIRDDVGYRNFIRYEIERDDQKSVLDLYGAGEISLGDVVYDESIQIDTPKIEPYSCTATAIDYTFEPSSAEFEIVDTGAKVKRQTARELINDRLDRARMQTEILEDLLEDMDAMGVE